jgi:hypothetical protein
MRVQNEIVSGYGFLQRNSSKFPIDISGSRRGKVRVDELRGLPDGGEHVSISLSVFGNQFSRQPPSAYDDLIVAHMYLPVSGSIAMNAPTDRFHVRMANRTHGAGSAPNG